MPFHTWNVEKKGSGNETAIINGYFWYYLTNDVRLKNQLKFSWVMGKVMTFILTLTVSSNSTMFFKIKMYVFYCLSLFDG